MIPTLIGMIKRNYKMQITIIIQSPDIHNASIMGRQSAINLLVSVLSLQLYIWGTHQIPLYNESISSVDEGEVKYMEIKVQNKTAPGTELENTTQFNDESFHLDETEGIQKLREQILLAKRSQLRIFAHDPEDILFMLTALVLLCFHLFFMDMFIRLTRTRFQTNSRYQYLSTVHLFLAFLVCTIYFLLILLHYRDSQYCG